MVTTQLQPVSNGKAQANGLRQPELSSHTLAANIRRMLDRQDQMEKQLVSIREQLELSQWSLFIREAIDDAEPVQLTTDVNTPRELLMVAVEFFEAAQSSMAEFVRDCTAFTPDIPDLGPDGTNAASDIFGE